MARRSRNALQESQLNTFEEFDKLYALIMSDIQKKNPVTHKQVKKIFEDNNYIPESETIILNANLDSTLIGLGSTHAIKSIPELNKYYLNTPYEGLKLSSRIRTSQTEAVREVTRVINQNLKFQTSWKQLSKEIAKKSNTIGDVSKVITDLGEQGNKFIKGKLSPEEIKSFKSLINKAQKQVNMLSPGLAPTKSLKNSYQRVIDSVSKNDTVLLNKSVKNAFDQKIAYNNDRISRSELSRSQDLSFRRSIYDDDIVVGFIWKLSPQHPRTDICDFYADLNNGEGKGVYRKEDTPSLPAHPNCLCMLQPYVIEGDRENKAKFMNKTNSVEQLDRLSEKERGRIIGVENARFKSKYVKGLENKGVSFEGGKPQALPQRLVTKNN